MKLVSTQFIMAIIERFITGTAFLCPGRPSEIMDGNRSTPSSANYSIWLSVGTSIWLRPDQNDLFVKRISFSLLDQYHKFL